MYLIIFSLLFSVNKNFTCDIIVFVFLFLIHEADPNSDHCFCNVLSVRPFPLFKI